VLALLVTGAMIAAGCGGSDDNSGSSGASATTSPATASPDTSAPAATSGGDSSGSASAAKIEGFAFHPDTIKVNAGQKLSWTNDDTATHTVTADDASFDSGSLAAGKAFSFTFSKPGTFKYHCSIHSSMHGAVDVS
jgi:plastocyanin